MALFTDGDVSSIEDLRAYDTQLLDVANTEGIDVTGKLKLAQEEIAAEIATLLARNLRYAVATDCGRVVVTPPLKLWHTFLSLELVYRDAYRNQLNDRYAGKRDEFHGMVKWAYDKVVQTGLGIVNDPVGKRAFTPVWKFVNGGLPDVAPTISQRLRGRIRGGDGGNGFHGGDDRHRGQLVRGEPGGSRR